MDKQLSRLLKASIKLEQKVAHLYMIFRKALPEDADFWQQLATEEKSHVALLQSGRKHYGPVDMFPTDLVSATLEEVEDTNANLAKLIAQYRRRPPSREAAFNTALRIEQSAGEVHFQNFMKRQARSDLERLFQQINREDKDHEVRIRSYMEEHAIEITDCDAF